jgi:hypothetical protein
LSHGQGKTHNRTGNTYIGDAKEPQAALPSRLKKIENVPCTLKEADGFGIGTRFRSYAAGNMIPLNIVPITLPSRL